MSRALKSIRRPRLGRAAAGLGIAGLAAVLALAGCSAGQDTQTDSAPAAVNGAQGQAGPIAIRDAVIAFPSGGVYPAGAEAPLVLTIVNTGSADDELVEVSSAAAAEVAVSGDRRLTARRSIQVGTPGEEASGRPATTTPTPTSTSGPVSTVSSTTVASGPGSATSVSGSSAPGSATSVSATSTSAEPVEIGRATIVLVGLSSPLNSGKNYPVTFVFRNAGSITIELPIAAPTSARQESAPSTH